MEFLTVNGIGKKENGNYQVRSISFSQQPLQQIAIAGETGSGKTTLLKIIAGLEQPGEGTVLFEGQRVLGPFEKLLPGHPSIAYLSQHFELRNNYRVEEELESKNLLDPDEAARIYRVCRIEHLLKRKTTQLSGGERQRIVLARLLTTSPKLLLLDEPFSNLDAPHKAIIKSVLQDIRNMLKVSCILVSHDAADILSWADKIIILKDGEMVQQGTPEEVYRQPVNEYCAGLLGDYNLVEKNETGNSINGRKQLIRPEELVINGSSGNTISAEVLRSAYYGSHYIITVKAGEQLLKIRAAQNIYHTGEKVQIAFPAAVPWYV